MDVEEHYREFERIAERYGLRSEERAGAIADFLTKHSSGVVCAEEFSVLFGMSAEKARVFLSFIERGVRFKESSDAFR